jgi:hypothetical protein
MLKQHECRYDRRDEIQCQNIAGIDSGLGMIQMVGIDRPWRGPMSQPK